jgi:hypothetical protein
MPTIFEQLDGAVDYFKNRLSSYTAVDEGHDYSWPNFVFTGGDFRRAHLDVVDVRSTKKLYMVHLCVFPNTNDPSPVYGFDIIAGPNKVTGAFHDFSPIAPNHFMSDWFADHVADIEWSKPRILPDWAKQIFSNSMVAAGNISSEDELNKFLNIAISSFNYYIKNIGQHTGVDYTANQNNYCANQKKNPHTPRVMSALGFSDEEIRDFIENCLFPEVCNIDVG